MRYTGKPKRIYDYMDRFVVHCPKCNGKAEVIAPHFLDYKKAKLSCSSCHFSDKMIDRVRYVVSGKAKCTYCIEWLNLEMEGKKKMPKYTNIKCSSCQKINKVSENWTEVIEKYNEEGFIDPAFGLTLWFTDEVKSEVIWAYNEDHLLEIKSYVASTLRERSTDKFKMTMVEKLPNFIKLAKNRDEVLKALVRMETK